MRWLRQLLRPWLLEFPVSYNLRKLRFVGGRRDFSRRLGLSQFGQRDGLLNGLSRPALSFDFAGA